MENNRSFILFEKLLEEALLGRAWEALAVGRTGVTANIGSSAVPRFFFWRMFLRLTNTVCNNHLEDNNTYATMARTKTLAQQIAELDDPVPKGVNDAVIFPEVLLILKQTLIQKKTKGKTTMRVLDRRRVMMG